MNFHKQHNLLTPRNIKMEPTEPRASASGHHKRKIHFQAGAHLNRSTDFHGTKYDAVIIGGGMIGLTLAVLLSKHQFSVAVVESNPFVSKKEKLTARVSAIHLSSQKLFSYLEIWQTLQKTATPMHDMKIWDHTLNAHLHFDSHDFQETELGWIISNQEIINTLHHKLSQSKTVDFFCPNNPIDFSVEHNQVILVLQNGEKIQADLIIGADGAHSWVRKQLPIHMQIRPYYQKAIIAVIESALPHLHCAYQKFLTTGPVALLPLSHPNQTALVWSADEAISDELMQKSDAAFHDALTEATDFKLGKLKCVTKREQFPLIMRHTDEYVAAHFALVGDAAHTIHPLAGLGANLGLMDVACLTQVLLDARSTKKSLSAFQTLRRYTRWRKTENLMIITGMRTLKEIFSIDTPWFNLARSTAVNILDQSNWMKNALIRVILGECDEQPEFLESRRRNAKKKE